MLEKTLMEFNIHVCIQFSLYMCSYIHIHIHTHTHTHTNTHTHTHTHAHAHAHTHTYTYTCILLGERMIRIEIAFHNVKKVRMAKIKNSGDSRC